jgi:hypothetical protein
MQINPNQIVIYPYYKKKSRKIQINYLLTYFVFILFSLQCQLCKFYEKNKELI